MMWILSFFVFECWGSCCKSYTTTLSTTSGHMKESITPWTEFASGFEWIRFCPCFSECHQVKLLVHKKILEKQCLVIYWFCIKKTKMQWLRRLRDCVYIVGNIWHSWYIVSTDCWRVHWYLNNKWLRRVDFMQIPCIFPAKSVPSNNGVYFISFLFHSFTHPLASNMPSGSAWKTCTIQTVIGVNMIE